jgi:Lrp/AsnC family leucine-responsive transcriptional regulator
MAGQEQPKRVNGKELQETEPPPSRRREAVKLDDYDLHILRTLQGKARITNTALAKKVGMSPPSTLERVKKLEARGVIRKYAAVVDADTVGRGTVALVSVTLREHGLGPLDALKSAITRFDEVLACWHTAGEEDFILKVVVEDMNAYEDFVTHKLSSLPHIGRIRTTFVLNTVKETTELLL